jgi:hypothetical protein
MTVNTRRPALDEIRYVDGTFTDFEIGSFAATAVRGDRNATWNSGSPPH